MSDHIFRPKSRAKPLSKKKRLQTDGASDSSDRKRKKVAHLKAATSVEMRMRNKLTHFFKTVVRKSSAHQKVDKLVSFYATKENGEEKLNVRLRSKYGADLSAVGHVPPAGKSPKQTAPSFLFLGSAANQPANQASTMLSTVSGTLTKKRKLDAKKPNKQKMPVKYRAFLAEHQISVNGSILDGTSS